MNNNKYRSVFQGEWLTNKKYKLCKSQNQK